MPGRGMRRGRAVPFRSRPGTTPSRDPSSHRPSFGLSSRPSRQTPKEPRAGGLPLARDGRSRDAKYLRDFALGHSGEVAEFHDLSLAPIYDRELSQRLVEEQDFAGGRPGGPDPLVEGD